MQRALQAAIVGAFGFAWFAACGGNGSSGSSSGGDDAGGVVGGGDGSTGSGGEGGSTGGKDAASNDDGGVPPAPKPVCTPPEIAADVSTPATTVGTGTAASCTEDLLAAAVAKAGVIVFSCGVATTTIHLTKSLNLRTDVDTVIDGKNLITLDGGDAVSILRFDHNNYRANNTKLTLQHLTLAHGKIAGTKPYASAPAPCSQGFYDGYGGALLMHDGVLLVVDVTFLDNNAEHLGPDVGGGAISLQGNKKVTILGSVFKGNKGSNGGAIESLNSELDVYNTTFDTSEARGNGANSDDAAKCSVVATNGQHQVGSGGNGGAVAIDGADDLTHTFCGVTFTGNKSGPNALGGAVGRTPDNAKQTTVFDRCLFDGNIAAGNAGAMYFHNSTLQVKASTFHANKAVGGAVIQSDGTTYDFQNDTFADNETTGTGAVGGVILAGDNGKISSCTFVGNKVDGFGAAIFGKPTFQIDNCLFANNIGQNPGAAMQCDVAAGTTGSGNLQFPRNHVVGSVPDSLCVPGITFADPLLAAIAANGGPTPTALPGAGSPALSAGLTCLPTDQRGNPRKPTKCTAGAVEIP